MLGLYVTVPIACFRKGLAREYLETEWIPPPSTCYGFLLSFVGEVDRKRHEGARVTVGLIGNPDRSVVLRTVWRVKAKPLGSGGNARPDYQQLLCNVRLVIWIDSSEELHDKETLENRVAKGLDPKTRSEIDRFGGLSLGESTHMVDEVVSIDRMDLSHIDSKLFTVKPKGRLTLPVWVDHVGSAGTRYSTGDLIEQSYDKPPKLEEMPRISSVAPSGA
jgi:CRISPR-associated protein Cas5t